MHATSVYIAREQFIRHQTVDCMQTCSEDFHTHVVRALFHTHVFMKFKSSCTVYAIITVHAFNTYTVPAYVTIVVINICY